MFSSTDQYSTSFPGSLILPPLGSPQSERGRGGKMRDPGNEVGQYFYWLTVPKFDLLPILLLMINCTVSYPVMISCCGTFFICYLVFHSFQLSYSINQWAPRCGLSSALRFTSFFNWVIFFVNYPSLVSCFPWVSTWHFPTVHFPPHFLSRFCIFYSLMLYICASPPLGRSAAVNARGAWVKAMERLRFCRLWDFGQRWVSGSRYRVIIIGIGETPKKTGRRSYIG